MNRDDQSDWWETYLAMRELAVIATCVLFFLCGAWWYIPMNLISIESLSLSGWLAGHAEFAKVTLVNDTGITIVVVLAVQTYKRRFFLPLFLVGALAIWVYLIYLNVSL
ncbi:MAG: hypothetical protein QOH93_2561 [Chloroflexia bacterium]|jgi:hypothetical protein|nr:hypothetical protein [Chloroflexia bacterium]